MREREREKKREMSVMKNTSKRAFSLIIRWYMSVLDHIFSCLYNFITFYGKLKSASEGHGFANRNFIKK